MIPLAELKQNLEFNRNLNGIVDVLKVAASVQLRQLQATTYLHTLFPQEVVAGLRVVDLRSVAHPFLRERSSLPTCLVVITSDEGFSGGLNALLINTALRLRDQARGDQLVMLGERGAAVLEDLRESFTAFPGVAEEMSHAPVTALKRHLVRRYLKGDVGKVVIVYAKFLGISSQQIEAEQLLPYRPSTETRAARRREPSFIEPSADRVVEGLVSLWLECTIAAIFLSSKLAEVSARIMHLEGSDQELSRMNQILALQHVKHLHALADKSIREISVSRLHIRH